MKIFGILSISKGFFFLKEYEKVEHKHKKNYIQKL